MEKLSLFLPEANLSHYLCFLCLRVSFLTTIGDLLTHLFICRFTLFLFTQLLLSICTSTHTHFLEEVTVIPVYVLTFYSLLSILFSLDPVFTKLTNYLQIRHAFFIFHLSSHQCPNMLTTPFSLRYSPPLASVKQFFSYSPLFLQPPAWIYSPTLSLHCCTMLRPCPSLTFCCIHMPPILPYGFNYPFNQMIYKCLFLPEITSTSGPCITWNKSSMKEVTACYVFGLSLMHKTVPGTY